MILIYILLSVSILFLLCSISKRIYFYITVCFLYFTLSMVMVLSFPVMICRGRTPKNGFLPCYMASKVLEMMGFTIELRGLENINKAHGSIIIMNHQSFIDCFVISKLMINMKNLCGTAKHSLLYSGPFGWGMWYLNTFFLKRQNISSCKNTISESSRCIRQNNYKVFYFPEGTRTNTKQLLPFKLGAFYAALEAGCPIQPIAISRQHFMFPGKFENKYVIVEILPEISTKELTKETIRSFSENCRSVMQKKVDKLSDELILKYKSSNIDNVYK